MANIRPILYPNRIVLLIDVILHPIPLSISVALLHAHLSAFAVSLGVFVLVHPHSIPFTRNPNLEIRLSPHPV